MRAQQDQVFLAARIPFELKAKLSTYCLGHGVKINYLVAEAIKQKLSQIAEEKEDIAIAKRRLKDAEFLSPKELRKYLLKRGVKP